MNTLTFRNTVSDHQVAVEPARAIIAGFTGRDRDAVEEHLVELEAQGIPRPSSVPVLYEVEPDRITQAGRIAVGASNTSGEVEPVLVCTEDGWLVTLGSDHTDRDLERVDITLSKNVCSKPVASDALPYETVRDRWSSLHLRSWVGRGPTSRLYQDGPLSYITPPDDLLRFVEAEIGPLEPGTFVFLGTVPLHDGGFVADDRYVLEMADPHGDLTLSHQYDVEQGRTR